MDTLSARLEMDKADFNISIAIPRHYEESIVRIIPGIYSTYSFGGAVSEERAIELAKAYAVMYNHECMINYPGLSSIKINPDGSVRKWHYCPSLEVTKAFVKFGRDGSDSGTTRIH